MLGLIFVFGSESDFGQSGHFQSSTVVFKNLPMNAWEVNLNLKTLLFDFLEDSHQWDYLP